MNDYEVHVDDLTELHRCGAVHLPTVAIQYSAMATALHKTALSEGAAFDRSIGGTSPVQAAFAELRNLVQGDITVRTYENLVAAGDVLARIAASYATADYLNGQELAEYQEYVEGLDDPDTPDHERPPYYVPDPPSPGDPHPEHAPQHPGI